MPKKSVNLSDHRQYKPRTNLMHGDIVGIVIKWDVVMRAVVFIRGGKSLWGQFFITQEGAIGFATTGREFSYNVSDTNVCSLGHVPWQWPR